MSLCPEYLMGPSGTGLGRDRDIFVMLLRTLLYVSLSLLPLSPSLLPPLPLLELLELLLLLLLAEEGLLLLCRARACSMISALGEPRRLQ